MSKIIIANWKMNPQTLKEAGRLFTEIKKTALATRKVSTIIAPPCVFLHSLASSSRARRLAFAAQNIHFTRTGAQVGEVSAHQVQDSGASYVLIGHSARREAGETNEEVAKKVAVALDTKLAPVIFVGEAHRDAHGIFLRSVRKQITSALENVPASRFKDIILVYEPVWAISANVGTGGATITINEIHQMVLFVHKILTESFGAVIARKIKILYGGSANSDNLASILEVPGVAGVVVGAASLNAQEFRSMLQIANKAV